jgi:hypothetical protein
VEQLISVARRIGLNPPMALVPRKVMRAQVRAVWKQHPEFTAKQVIASLGPRFPLGEGATSRLLRECRLAVVQHSPVRKQATQWLDSRTVMRVRIAILWNRHPEYTATQVMKALGLEGSVGVKWVRRVLRFCWQASAKRSATERLTGRRVYSPWRSVAKHFRSEARAGR